MRAWLTLYETGGLKALLTSKQAPGKVSLLSSPALAKRQTRLDEPRGFASDSASQSYLAREHHLRLSYSAVHALVRYKLGAKPKAPRRSHPKKTLKPARSFRKRSVGNS